MPFVTWAWALTTQLTSVRWAEFGRPFPNRFVAHADARIGHQLFDVAEADGESKIEPDGVADDLGREAMAAIEGGTGLIGRHEVILRGHSPAQVDGALHVVQGSFFNLGPRSVAWFSGSPV